RIVLRMFRPPACRAPTIRSGLDPRMFSPVRIAMASKQSFDVSTGVDIQEVDNAVNQTIKESQTRYDFKGSKCVVELDRAAFSIKLDADDEFRLEQLMGILREKLSRRQVPLKNVDEGKVEIGGLGRARQLVRLKNGIDQETA